MSRSWRCSRIIGYDSELPQYHNKIFHRFTLLNQDFISLSQDYEVIWDCLLALIINVLKLNYLMYLKCIRDETDMTVTFREAWNLLQMFNAGSWLEEILESVVFCDETVAEYQVKDLNYHYHFNLWHFATFQHAIILKFMQ